jgi:uncharacterized protein
MRTMNAILFFGTFFLLYGLINLYVFVRGWQSIPQDSPARLAYIPVFLFLALSFIGGRFLENVWLSVASDVLIWVGSFWLAAMIYLLLAISFVDLLRAVNHGIPFFPEVIRSSPENARAVTALVIVAAVALVLAAGHVNALTPRIRRLTVTIPKPATGMQSLRIVAASDIHLGTLVGKRRLERIVGEINSLHPDIVLLPGDILDEDLAPVLKQNLGQVLRGITSPLGVFAITGNHEYIGGVEEACAYLSRHGITMLRDRVAKVHDRFYLIGREDRSVARFTGKARRHLHELMAGVDDRLPILLMDHQPFHLEEGVKNGADLQLSGHTHNGQIWPFNLITRAVYEVSWGYKAKGKTHVYVSCGLGTWGPPIRVGNRPEIVEITLRFKE